MTKWPKALATAFIFLTRIPMPTLDTIEPEDQGRSLVFFPIVGFAIGLLLVALALLFSSSLSSLVLAAILTAAWAAITGGLHLDGLADSADGWLAGANTIDRTLEIMHDSRCGSGALVAVSCLLILKFATLTVIIEQQQWAALLLAPVLGRCVAALLFIRGTFFYTPYVQPSGIAKHFIDHGTSLAHRSVLITLTLCALCLGDFSKVIMAITVSAIMLYLLRRLMLQRLGGATGDTAGAATEIIEVSILMTYCCLL
jgi:adenosylcobinamide-GDP ribazoletransferase